MQDSWQVSKHGAAEGGAGEVPAAGVLLHWFPIAESANLDEFRLRASAIFGEFEADVRGNAALRARINHIRLPKSGIY
jgi:hypothetical protein